jgi:hypothetical protein
VPGSGLGLSLVAAIAALHEIEIMLADNRPGLRVQLRFPPHALSAEQSAERWVLDLERGRRQALLWYSKGGPAGPG